MSFPPRSRIHSHARCLQEEIEFPQKRPHSAALAQKFPVIFVAAAELALGGLLVHAAQDDEWSARVKPSRLHLMGVASVFEIILSRERGARYSKGAKILSSYC